MNLKKHVLSVLLLVAVPICAIAQNVTVKGQVKDDAGEPIILANILQVGTSNGTATDLDGNYSISVPSNATLQFSFMGYETQTVAVNGRTTINVTLSEDSELLDEVVVIGYGVQKKSDLTGAVASVKAADLKDRSVTDAGAALQGKVSGIQIINTSGAPGQGASIRVRGYSSNSTTGGLGPLLIVDGLQVDNIQYLDPEMIESMEVLKDAASAAIYGAQAGNGVILITTKKGETGSAHISYSGKFALQSLGKQAELFRAEEYITYQNYIGSMSDVQAESFRKAGIDTNWYDEAFASSWSKQHNITVQGGNDKGHFLTSINYLNNDGIVVGDKDVYKRLTAQINADYKLFKWFDISTSNSIEKWSTKSVSSGYGSTLNSVISIDPLTPAYYSKIEDTPATMQAQYALTPDLIPRDPNHNNDFYGTSKYLEEATGNPLFQRDKTDSYSGGINLRGNIAANLTPLKGLTFTSRFGYTVAQDQSHSYTPAYWLTSMASSTTYSISANVNTSYTYQWENFVNYNANFGKNSVNLMAGMSYRETNRDNASISGSDAELLKSYEPNFIYIDYMNAGVTKSVGNAPSQATQLSYFGRLGYTYDNRYGIQANFRADAYDSSKLSPTNRWGYFPSVSAGWTISNESFFKDNIDPSIVSFLKLRGSWGLNGNINVLNNYKYSTSIALNGEWYQYNPSLGDGTPTYGSKPSGLANPDLKWETSEQYDLGIDARFLDNRLTFGFDWYKKYTNDLLVTISPLPEIGVSSSTVNAGKVLNSGIELELGWRDRVGDLTYNVSANFSTLHNEVLEMHSLLNRINGSGVSGLNNKLKTSFETGFPIWYFRGYKYAGVVQDDDKEKGWTAGQALYYDKDGKLTTAPGDNDMQYLGEGIPDFTYGLTINLAWKGFDFTLFGTGAKGNEIYNLMVSADRPKVNSLTEYWRNSWGNPNVDKASAKYPDMSKVAQDWVFFSSSASIFDGSFFKIKQIQLGYTLPKKITKKALISDMRVYTSIDDFFTFTSYPGADPETASYNSSDSRGIDSGSYPTTKKVVFGVNLTF
ncbi:MAG: TonB-dependent receptor [Bacteroidaceae bacterium]|nr:TonB-dependent receptor [Bacteroidaceae bacterium]